MRLLGLFFSPPAGQPWAERGECKNSCKVREDAGPNLRSRNYFWIWKISSKVFEILSNLSWMLPREEDPCTLLWVTFLDVAASFSETVCLLSRLLWPRGSCAGVGEGFLRCCSIWVWLKKQGTLKIYWWKDKATETEVPRAGIFFESWRHGHLGRKMIFFRAILITFLRLQLLSKIEEGQPQTYKWTHKWTNQQANEQTNKWTNRLIL